MPTQKILQNTKFNFSLRNENGEKGFNWVPEINMSFQNKDSIGTLKEILNMIRVNKFNIDLSIELKDGSIIHYKE